MPEPIARKRRERLQKEAKRKGRPVSAERLTMCAWMVFITNTTATQLSWQEVWTLARCRWQIELLFKAWKSGGGGLSQSRGRQPWRVLCEVYAKLLGMVVRQWLLCSGGVAWVQQNAAAAARAVRSAAEFILVGLAEATLLEKALERLQQRLDPAARRQGRRSRPAAWQLLQNTPSLDALEEAA